MIWESLERWIPLVPPGLALDLGAGEGEISLWLAGRGFEVEALERSSEAAQRLAARGAGLAIRVIPAELTAFAYGTDRYSLIVASSILHFLRPTQLWELADGLIAALAPGGVLVAEVFTTDDPGFDVQRGAAKEVEPNTFLLESGEALHYFGRGELRRVFANLEVLEYEEERRSDPDSAEGFRAGAALVARKPG